MQGMKRIHWSHTLKKGIGEWLTNESGIPRVEAKTLLCWVREAQPQGWHTAGPGVDVWTAVGLLLPPFLPQEVPDPYGPKVGMPLPLHGHGARGALPGRVLLCHGQTGQASGKHLESLCQARGSSRTRAETLQCPPPSASSFLRSPPVTSTGHPASF